MLKIIDDQVGCPTYAQDLVKVTVAILHQLTPNQVCGLYHYCGDYSCSWYGFAKIIFKTSSRMGLGSPERLISVKTTEFPTAAERPKYSVLDTYKMRSSFPIITLPIEDAVRTALCNVRQKKF